jgi:hypothetical protein
MLRVIVLLEINELFVDVKVVEGPEEFVIEDLDIYSGAQKYCHFPYGVVVLHVCVAWLIAQLYFFFSAPPFVQMLIACITTTFTM